jgi:hypothetical protein
MKGTKWALSMVLLILKRMILEFGLLGVCYRHLWTATPLGTLLPPPLGSPLPPSPKGPPPLLLIGTIYPLVSNLPTSPIGNGPPL